MWKPPKCVGLRGVSGRGLMPRPRSRWKEVHQLVSYAGGSLVWRLLVFSLASILLCGYQSPFGVDGLGASTICNRIPGLSPKQRTICQSQPDAMAAVGEGDKEGLKECQFQFRFQRWNCTTFGDIDDGMSTIGRQFLGYKETAFMYAIRSASVSFYVTQACSQGNLSSCGCDKNLWEGRSAPQGWKWGGCSANYKYGLHFSRMFLDAKEIEEDSRSLMNLHNNRAGRKVLLDSMTVACKCHGYSGSCTSKTCWTTLPRFRVIGDRLKAKYQRARRVEPVKGHRAMRPVLLKLRRSSDQMQKPKRRDLVFLQKSPDFCVFDPVLKSLGTRGRVCNRTSATTDGCEWLCCGRGHVTVEQTRTWQCNCRFHWCCRVSCQKCSESLEVHTCQ